MSNRTSLKSKMAGAVLALGISGAAPAFALDSLDDAGSLVKNQTEASQTTIETSYDWYNSDIPLEAFWIAFAALMGGGLALSVGRKEDGWEKASRTLRMGTIATAFAWVAYPQVMQNEQRTLPTIFPVYVDKSFSVGDRAPMVEEAFVQLERELNRVGAAPYRVDFGGPDQGGNKGGTNLGDALSSTLDALPADRIGASFVITDGILHDQSYFMDVPSQGYMHAMVVGNDQEQDFFVKIDEAPQMAVIGEDQNIVLRIVDSKNRSSSDLAARLNVYFDGKLVTQKDVTVNTPVTMALSEINKEGLGLGDNLLEFSIESISGSRVASMDIDGDGQSPDEVTKQNNKAALSIRGIDSDIRVMMLTGEPNRNTQVLRSMLVDDPNVTLEHYIHSWPLQKQDGGVPLRERATYPFPVEEVVSRLKDTDIAILDEYSYNGVIPVRFLNVLNNYVENGGGLIVIGKDSLTGPTSLARGVLGPVLPMVVGKDNVDGAFTPNLTETGKRHPVGQAMLDGGYGQNWGSWLSTITAQKTPKATEILNDGRGNSVLALQEIGKGKVVMLGTDQAYLWGRGYDGGGPLSQMYRAAIGWAADNKDYDEEQLSLSRRGNDIVIEQRTMDDNATPVIVETPSGKEIKIIPEQVRDGLYAATISADEYGPYRVRREGADAAQAFAINGFEDVVETDNLISNTEIIRPLTDAQHGITVRVSDVNGAVSIPAIKIVDPGTISGADQTVMNVVMTDVKEVVGTPSQKPLIPDYIYGLAFAMTLLLSFRVKEAVRAFGIGRNKNAAPEEPSL